MRSRSTTMATLALTSILLVSCGGEKSGSSSRPGDQTLVIAFSTSPTNLDARVGNDNASGRIFDLIYSGLIRITPQNEYAPDLAEKWETPDDLTVIFHLRPNLKFQNGQPLTSKDVKWTYDSLMAPDFVNSKKAGYAAVDHIEAPDPNTVIFKLKEPNGGLFANLTLGIMPTGADTNVYKSKPIGAGPYRVVEFDPDDRVVMEAFEQWHLGAPKIKKVIARIIPDATTRVLELQRGTVNFEVNAIPLDTVSKFENNKDFTVDKKAGATYQYLAFNLRDERLSKLKVRQAIAHAIDRQKIVNDLLLGYGKVTDTMMPEGFWGHADNLPTYKADPAKARQLLDEAGYPDPDGDGPKTRFALTIKTSTDTEANQRAQLIQQMLKQVGIALTIQSNEFGTFYEDIGKGNFQMFSLSRGGVLDPDFYQVVFHTSSFPPEGQNRGYYANKRVDQLIVEGRATFDRQKRKVIYDEIQKILAEELPYISLYHQTNIAVMRNYIKGYEMYPAGFLLSVQDMSIEGGK
ncbi:MAG: ABC transporter substrate-binding protein [Acidobacteriota bacterium]